MEDKPVVFKPIPEKLPLRFKMCSFLPGFCSYCGKRYIDAYSKQMNLLFPVPHNGKMCPDGHEGYINENYLCGIIKHKIDNVVKKS